MCPHDVYDWWIEKYGRTLDAFWPVVDTEIGRLGIMMANEGSYPENARALAMNGAEVVYHDPFVDEVTFDHAYTIGDGEPLKNQELTDDLISGSDCVIICTEHSGVDYARVCQLAPLIVDTRNSLSVETRNGSKARIVRL